LHVRVREFSNRSSTPIWPVAESPVAVTNSWEKVQFGVATFACVAGTVVLVDPVDAFNTPVAVVATRVDVVEPAE